MCSGIGAPEVAASALGWRGVWACEVDKSARAIFQHRHPDVELLGDMTEVDWDARRSTVDVLCAGTPCQSFSVAGQRGGLADARGDLTRHFFTEVVPAVRPRWVVWENVPGVMSDDEGRTFGTILGWLAENGYGWAYRVLDAQWFGVAQRRRRVFVVGCAGGAWQRAAAVLLEPESMRGDPAPSREAGARVAGTLEARARTGGYDPGDHGAASGHLIPEVATTIRARDASKGVDSSATDTLILAPDVADPISANEGKTYNHEGANNFRLHNCVAYGIKSHNSEAKATHAHERAVSGPVDSLGGYAPGQGGTVVAYGGNDTRGPIDVATALNATHTASGRQDFESETFIAFAQNQRNEVRELEVAGSLPVIRRGDAKNETVVAFNLRGRDEGAQPEVSDVASLRAASGGSSRSYVAHHGVRRLTPTECERLQGFDDGYTLVPAPGKNRDMADGPRYRCLGNSMAVPVLEWIFRRMEAAQC